MNGVPVNFDAAVLNSVKEAVKPTPLNLKDVAVSATTGSLTGYLCDELFDVLQQQSFQTLEFTVEDLKDMVQIAIDFRVAYVSGLRTNVHPKNFEYPSFLGPILGQIGIYRNDVKGLELRPTLKAVVSDAAGTVSSIKTGDPSGNQAYASGYVSKWVEKDCLMVPETYGKLVRKLRTLGVTTNFGIPMDKVITDDYIYRIQEVDECLLGSSDQLPPVEQLLVRTLVKLSELQALFGENRVLYSTMVSLRRGITEIAMRAVRPRTYSPM